MSTPADDKRWAIAPPPSDESDGIGVDLALHRTELDGRRSTKAPARRRESSDSGASSTRRRIAPPEAAQPEASRPGGTPPEAGRFAGSTTGAPSSREVDTLREIDTVAPNGAQSERVRREPRLVEDDGDTIPAPSWIDELE